MAASLLLPPRAGLLLCLVVALLTFSLPGWARDEFNRNDSTSIDRSTSDRLGNEPGLAAELVMRALSLLGVTYRFGGNDPATGLDCSGLVRHVFNQAAGLTLPRRSEEISQTGSTIPHEQLRPGDLVFFNTLRRAFSHVGIYIGNNQFVHAPARGGNVRIENLRSSYWVTRFDGARRLAVLDGPVDSAGLLRVGGTLDAGSKMPVTRPSAVSPLQSGRNWATEFNPALMN